MTYPSNVAGNEDATTRDGDVRSNVSVRACEARKFWDLARLGAGRWRNLAPIR